MVEFNPFEKYDRPISSFLQVGVKIKKSLKPPPKNGRYIGVILHLDPNFLGHPTDYVIYVPPPPFFDNNTKQRAALKFKLPQMLIKLGHLVPKFQENYNTPRYHTPQPIPRSPNYEFGVPGW